MSTEQEKEYVRCQRCGKSLKNPKYRELGFGPSCYKKHIAGQRTSSYQLFTNKSEVKQCD